MLGKVGLASRQCWALLKTVLPFPGPETEVEHSLGGFFCFFFLSNRRLHTGAPFRTPLLPRGLGLVKLRYWHKICFKIFFFLKSVGSLGLHPALFFMGVARTHKKALECVGGGGGWLELFAGFDFV